MVDRVLKTFEDNWATLLKEQYVEVMVEPLPRKTSFLSSPSKTTLSSSPLKAEPSSSPSKSTPPNPPRETGAPQPRGEKERLTGPSHQQAGGEKKYERQLSWLKNAARPWNRSEREVSRKPRNRSMRKTGRGNIGIIPNRTYDRASTTPHYRCLKRYSNRRGSSIARVDPVGIRDLDPAVRCVRLYVGSERVSREPS